MTLEWRNVDLPFAQGLDTKSDPLQIPVGKLSECVNGRFVKSGRIQKRLGFDALSGAAVTAITATATLGDQLIAFDGTLAYDYSNVAANWQSCGSCVAVKPEELSVPIATQYCTSPDVAYLSGVEAYAYVDSLGHAHFMTVDAVTRAVLVPDTDIASPSAYQVKALALGTNFLVLVYKQSTQKLSYVLVAPTATSIGALTELSAYSLYNPGIWDAAVISGSLYIAYSDSNEHVHVAQLDTSMTGLANGAEAFAYRPATTMKAVSVFASGATRPVGLAYIYEDTSVNTHVAANSFSADVSTSGTPVRTSYGTLNDSGKHVAGIAAPGAAGQAYVFAGNLNAATPARPCIYSVLFDFAGSYALTTFLPLAYLQSKPYLAFGSTIAVPCGVPSNTQGFGYVVSAAGVPLARTNVGASTVSRTYAVLGESPSPATGQWLLVEPRTTRIINNSYTMGLGVARLTYGDRDAFRTTEVGGRLLMAGAIARDFDGNQSVEAGFLRYPDFYRTITPAGGSIPAGTYQWCFAYQWTDAQGVLHESAPCPALLTAFASPSQMTFAVECLPFTQKSNVRIVGYRTQDIATTGDTTFYRFTPPAGAANSLTATVTSITDNNANWATTNEVLYTAGGVVENVAPPPSVRCTSWKSRCWLVGADGHTLWYSKLRQPGFPIDFNDGFSVTIEDRNGPVTALGVMDDHLIIFTATSIYHLVGEGPDNLGQSDDYGLPQLVTTDVGCERQGSVVVTPNGLMFQSRKGIYLLNRSFQAQYVGAPVEQYNADTVVAAVLMQDSNEVRFTQATRTLVYNYLFDQWSTFTLSGTAVDSGVWRGTYYYAQSGGALELEQSAAYDDDGVATSLTLTTGWLPLAGLQGYQRVRDLLLLAIAPYTTGHVAMVGASGFSTPSTLNGIVTIDVDGVSHACTLTHPVGIPQMLTALNSGLAGTATATQAPSSHITITTASSGLAATLAIRSGTLTAASLGFVDGQEANALNAHTISISLAYDYVDDFDTPVVVDSTDIESGLEQVRVFLNQPRCEAVKVKIVLTPKAGAEALEMPTLSGLTLRVGAKKGHAKTPATRQYGA